MYKITRAKFLYKYFYKILGSKNVTTVVTLYNDINVYADIVILYIYLHSIYTSLCLKEALL